MLGEFVIGFQACLIVCDHVSYLCDSQARSAAQDGKCSIQEQLLDHSTIVECQSAHVKAYPVLKHSSQSWILDCPRSLHQSMPQ